MAKQLTASWTSRTLGGCPVRFDPVSNESAYQTISATVRHSNEDGSVHLSTEKFTVPNGATRADVEAKFNRVEVPGEYEAETFGGGCSYSYAY